MSQNVTPRKACQRQIELYTTLEDPGIRPILAVELGKAKFDQLKALDEFRGGMASRQVVPEDTATRSTRMVKARDVDPTPASTDDDQLDTTGADDAETTPMSQNTVADVWERIADGKRWIGAVPVCFYREEEDVYLVGRPFLMGFDDGKPKVILNRILPRDGGNLNRTYANEWARPWIIARILDASGFSLSQTSLAVMKAKEPDTADERSVLEYLPDTARRTVEELMDYGSKHELAPNQTVEPALSHNPSFVRTEVLGYDRDFSLYNRIGFGDSIREVISVFQGEREPKRGAPPDRGLSLEYALKSES